MTNEDTTSLPPVAVESNDNVVDECDDEVSVAFLEEIFNARCQDLGLLASQNAFHRFESVLEKKISGSRFDMQQSGLGVHSVSVIAHWLSDDDQFTFLNLSKNAIGDNGVCKLAQLVQTNPFISELELRSNDITPAGFVELFNGLSKNSSITNLDVSTDTGFKKNLLGEKGAEALALMVKSDACSLRTLRLGNVGSIGLSTLALNGLRLCKTIRVLDLRANHLGDELIFAILAPLHSSSIEQLNISRNELTDGATRAIVDLLKNCPDLKLIDLSHNSLGKLFCSALSQILATTGVLHHLLLDNNKKLGSQNGLNSVFESLIANTSLRTLSLSHCGILNCTLLGELLKSTTTLLHKLVLSKNHFGDKGVEILAKALIINKSLSYLDISSNQLGDECGREVAKMLEVNETLHELILCDNKISNDSAEILLDVVGEKNSTLSRLALNLNGISMRIGTAIEDALRANKANVRAAKIFSYHCELEALQNEGREIREKVKRIQEALVFKSPEHAHEEVERAAIDFESFKDCEVRKTAKLKESNDEISKELREQIHELNETKEKIESEYRQLYRRSIQATHKMGMKISSEQRNKGTAFCSLRKNQKILRECSERKRTETLLLNALMQNLKDETGARDWMHEAVDKWSCKMKALNTQILSEYQSSLHVYLETLIPPPTKTTRIKQRWQRVKERRQQLLVNFDSENFFAWYFDPQRSVAPLDTSSTHIAEDETNGFAVHIKVATDSSMLNINSAKLVHASHSVYSMSLHGQAGRLNTMMVALNDPKLALEFKTFRADVSRIVINAPGHMKMDELKTKIAVKIGVDENDIAGLYHTTVSNLNGRKKRTLTDRQRISKQADTDVTLSDDGGEVEHVAHRSHRKSFQASKHKGRRSHLNISTSEKQKESQDITRPGSALSKVQKHFAMPDSDSDSSIVDVQHEQDDGENDKSHKDIDASDSSGIEQDDQDNQCSFEPPRISFITHTKPRRRSSYTANTSKTHDTNTDSNDSSSSKLPPSRSTHRRSSLPMRLSQPESLRSKAIRRQETQLMSWNLHHSSKRFEPKITPINTARQTMREANPNLELDPSVADEPMSMERNDTLESPCIRLERLENDLIHAEKNLGEMHPAVSTALMFLGAHFVETKCYDEAERAYVRAKRIRETTFGARHPHVATVEQSIADLYRRQKRYTEAEPLYNKVVRVREKTLGKYNPVLAETLTALGQLHLVQGNFDEAEPLYVRALTIRERIYGKRHPQVLESLQDIARLYQDRNEIARVDQKLETENDNDIHLAPDTSSLSIKMDNDSKVEQWHVQTRPISEINPAFKLDPDVINEQTMKHLEHEQNNDSFMLSCHNVALKDYSADHAGVTSHKVRSKTGRRHSLGAAHPDDDFDFRDAIKTVNIPNHWITRRKVLSIKPWNKLVSTSSEHNPIALSRVELPKRRLSLTIARPRKL